MRLFPKELCHSRLDSWHTCHTANKNNLVNIAGFQPRISQCFLTRRDGALDKVSNKCFELGTCELHVEMLRARGVSGNEGKVHFIRRGCGQLFLSLFSFFTKTL